MCNTMKNFIRNSECGTYIDCLWPVKKKERRLEEAGQVEQQIGTTQICQKIFLIVFVLSDKILYFFIYLFSRIF